MEGSYCADTRYAEKVAEKKEDEKLVNMLTRYGYDDVHLRPMPLGYAGTICSCNFQKCCKILDCKEQWLTEY